MTALTFTAGGTDITQYVEADYVEGQNDLTQRIDILKFRISQHALSTLSDKTEIIVTDQAGTRWFGGYVGHIERISESPERMWDVDVQGYAALLDGSLANKVYNGVSDTVMIADLLTTYVPELTLEAPQSNNIDHMAFPYKFVSNCLDDICAQTGFKYYVDPSKVLTYFNPNDVPPSLILSDDNRKIDQSTVWSYEQWKLRSDATQIQNRITVIGGNYLAPATTDSFTGDGTTTRFNLTHRPNSTSSVIVNGTQYAFGHAGVDSYGGGSGILALIDDAGQTVQFQTAPAAAAIISVTYDYYTPILMRVQNQQSHNLYGRWWDGRVSDGTVLSTASAVQRGMSALGQYAFAQQTVYATTRAPWCRSGQAVLVTNNADGVVNQKYLVQMTRWHLLGNGVTAQDLQLIGPVN